MYIDLWKISEHLPWRNFYVSYVKCCIEHFEISLALKRNTTGMILLIKFEVNREMYVEIPRYLYVF